MPVDSTGLTWLDPRACLSRQRALWDRKMNEILHAIWAQPKSFLLSDAAAMHDEWGLLDLVFIPLHEISDRGQKERPIMPSYRENDELGYSMWRRRTE